MGHVLQCTATCSRAHTPVYCTTHDSMGHILQCTVLPMIVWGTYSSVLYCYIVGHILQCTATVAHILHAVYTS